MIHFFRDVLDGPLYLVLVVVCIILIMAIIGFIMEQKRLEKEEKEKIVVVNGTTPIEPVRTREVVLNTNTDINVETIPNSLTNPEVEEIKQEQSFTIDSSSNRVNETEDNVKIEEVKVEDIAEVIDFGSTKDVNVDNDN